MGRTYAVLAMALVATYTALYLLVGASALFGALGFTIGIGFCWLIWLATVRGARSRRTRARSGRRRRRAGAGVFWAGGAAASVDCSGGSSGFGGDCGAGGV